MKTKALNRYNCGGFLLKEFIYDIGILSLYSVL